MAVEREIDSRNTAHSLLMEGRYADAIRAYDKALEMFPRDLALVQGQAYAYLGTNNVDAAIACLDRIVESDPRNALAIAAKGDLLGALDRLPEAIALYEEALKLDSGDPTIWQGKAFLLTRMGNSAEAFRCYTSALALDSLSAELWSGKGDAAFDLFLYEESLECYQRAASIEPFAATDWTRRGDQFFEVDRMLEAGACYDRAIEIDNKHAAAWRGKGLALSLHDAVSAVEFLDKALNLAEATEQKAGLWVDKGNLLARENKLDEADFCYDQALKLNPGEYSACVGKGRVLENQEKYESAVVMYDLALSIESTDGDVWEDKGRCLTQLDRLEEAVSCFDHSIERQPESFWARNDKGWALLKLKRYREAIAEYDEAIKIDKNQSWPWANKGEALIELGEYDAARNVLETALDEVSDRREILGRLAGLFGEYLFDDAQCLDIYSELLKFDPDDVGTKTAISELLLRLGKYSDARERALQCVQAEDPVLQCLANYIVLASYILEGDVNRRREYFANFTRDLITKNWPTITDEKWMFEGLTKRLANGKASIEDKYILLTLIDVLRGKIDVKRSAYFKNVSV